MTEKSNSFTLSYAFSEITENFDTPQAAGRAYALADAALAPRITEVRGRAARTLVRSISIAGQHSKSVTRPEDAALLPSATERDFWAGFHEPMFQQAA